MKKQRTTLALPPDQHKILADMSAKTDLEMSKIMQWGLASLMDITRVRSVMKKKDPKLHQKLDDTIETRSTFFLDTMSECIDK